MLEVIAYIAKEFHGAGAITPGSTFCPKLLAGGMAVPTSLPARAGALLRHRECARFRFSKYRYVESFDKYIL